MLYLGIDQHSKQLTVNLRGEDGIVLLRRQVSTQWPAVEAFFEDVHKRAQQHGGFVAILEVCGFNDWLLEVLNRYGARDIVLVQPEDRQQHKTDRRDAHRLGELLWVNRFHLHCLQSGPNPSATDCGKRPAHAKRGPGRLSGLRRVQIVSAQQREDRRLTTLRLRVGQMRTRVINRVKQVLRRRNRQHDCPTKGIQTKAARRWLEQLQKEQLRDQQLRDQQLHEEPLRQASELSELDRLELSHLLAQWQLLDGQQADLERRLQDRYQEHDSAKLVGTIPGAGAFTALGLATRVPDIACFPRPRSLANFFGLTPRCRDSGETKQRLGSITKEGSAVARFLLGQLVLHVLRRDGVMREWFRRIKRRRGAKIARVAVMRRLATILWHMLTKKQPYAVAKLPRGQAYAADGAVV